MNDGFAGQSGDCSADRIPVAPFLGRGMRAAVDLCRSGMNLISRVGGARAVRGLVHHEGDPGPREDGPAVGGSAAGSASRVVRWAVGGGIATLLIALGGVITGPRPPGVDFGSMPRFHRLLDSRPVATLGFVALYLGLAALVLIWLSVGAAVRSGHGPTNRELVLIFAVWATPLALGPPLFSRDIYSYAAQARMVAVGLNPYVAVPLYLGPSRFVYAVSPMWVASRAPYGPLFLSASGFLVHHTGSNLIAAVLGLRLLGLLGLALLAWSLPRLADHHGVSPRFALWLGLLNPLVLLHLVSGGHNDALMIGLLAVGLVAATRRSPIIGLVVCTLAASVKLPAAAGAVFIAIDWYRRDGAKTVAKSVAAVAGTFGLVTLSSGLGVGWVKALGNPGRVRTALSPMTGLGMLFGGIAHQLRLASSSQGFEDAARFVGVLIAAGVAVLLIGAKRLDFTRACALALVAVVLLGPVVQPWYLIWGIVLLAAIGPGRAERLLVVGSAVMAFTVWPTGSEIPLLLQVFVVVALGALALSTLFDARREVATKAV